MIQRPASDCVGRQQYVLIASALYAALTIGGIVNVEAVGTRIITAVAVVAVLRFVRSMWILIRQALGHDSLNQTSRSWLIGIAVALGAETAHLHGVVLDIVQAVPTGTLIGNQMGIRLLAVAPRRSMGVVAIVAGQFVAMFDGAARRCDRVSRAGRAAA